MRRSSSSVKGSFCSPLPSADALPLGFFTCLDGLRSSHSLDRQKSKKARTTDMSRLAVGTLTFHGNADLSGHGETRIVHPVELVVSQEIVHKHRLTVHCHLISHARYCPRVRGEAVTAAKLAACKSIGSKPIGRAINPDTIMWYSSNRETCQQPAIAFIFPPAPASAAAEWPPTHRLS